MTRIRKLANTAELARLTVVGINRRNIEFIYPHNPRAAYRLADDKALTKGVLEEGGVPVPDTFAVIEHQWELEEVVRGLESRETLVVKPARGSGGNGILILSKQGQGWRTPDGSYIDRERMMLHMAGILYGAYSHDRADRVIVEEQLVPDPFFKGIYDRGIPDIRVIVFRDEPLMAMLRVPTSTSRGKANLHQGAVGIGIDLEKGILGYGIRKNMRIGEHPDSGVGFRGMQVPRWERIIQVSRSAAGLVPLKFLGIDIILDEKRGPLVIEINARPGLQIQNANETGLLEALNRNLNGNHDQTVV